MNEIVRRNKDFHGWAREITSKVLSSASTYEEMWSLLNSSLEEAVSAVNFSLHDLPTKTFLFIKDPDELQTEDTAGKRVIICKNDADQTLTMRGSFGNLKLRPAEGWISVVLDCDPRPYYDEDSDSFPRFINAAMKQGSFTPEGFAKEIVEEFLEVRI